MLEALYPGRVDLGIGRAPGGDMRTAQALTSANLGGRYDAAEHFPQQVADLVGYLDGTLPTGHPFARVKAMPKVETAPQVWLLGSSEYSGLLAAHMGLRFAFAHFISARGGDLVTQAYRERFEPSAREAKPVSAVCAFVICAKTHDEAERLAASVDLRRVHMAKGIDHPVPTLEEADAYVMDSRERAYADQERARLIHGDPGEVREKLVRLKENFVADELLVLSITGDYATRRLSYRLVAEAFDLGTRATSTAAAA